MDTVLKDAPDYLAVIDDSTGLVRGFVHKSALDPRQGPLTGTIDILDENLAFKVGQLTPEGIIWLSN